MQIGALIRRAALYYGDAPCLVEGERVVSFREFDALTDSLGNALLERGFVAGDRVGVLLPNGIDCLVAYYALAKAGLVRVSLNTRETLADHAYKLSHSGSRGVIHNSVKGLGVEIAIDSLELGQLQRSGSKTPCAIDRDLDAPYRLGFTGGTTGRSKAVTLTMRGELAELSAFLTDLVPEISEGHTFLHAAPIAHASGAFFLPSLIRGARSLVMAKFDPEEFVRLAAAERAELTFLVPTMLAMVLEAPSIDEAAFALCCIAYGASPIAPALLERAEARFGRVFAQTYGQAESPMVITCLRPKDHDRIGSCGRPFTIVEVAVFDDEDRPLPAGERGEIVCRGPQTMAYYWNNPEATAAAFRGGWLHTGDIGYMDEDGFFYLVDRKNDMLISGGYNVYPREVEDVLLSCEGVVEAAVIGLPDEKWGDRVHAVVSGRSSLSADAVMAHARDRLASYKRPKGVEIWPELPKSSANKILRRAVRDRVIARQTPKTVTGQAPETSNVMVSETHLIMHGLAIKKHATPEAVASIVGLDVEDVRAALGKLVEAKRVVEAHGKYLLAPAARMALDTDYSRLYEDVRAHPDFAAGYEAFERLNGGLKRLITDWQTIDVPGEGVPNDHSNKAYDDRIIDRLGDLHERAEGALDRLACVLPRFSIYREKLGTALEKAEDGAIEWVSDTKIESYHTLWFELHEDLLRLMRREREE